MEYKQTSKFLLRLMVLVQLSSVVFAEMKADSHGPTGVMGDHMHKKGGFMTSYRYMHMDMGGIQNKGANIAANLVANTVANRFFGISGQPATLRVVPNAMNTHMHMFGAMYAPNDKLTLMAMGSYVEKKMKLTTYKGASGVEVRGAFTTQSSGWGDLKLLGLIKLFNKNRHHVHLALGSLLPTGSTSETDQVLTPMGMRPTKRLPYGMQLGSGNYGILNGLTYRGSCHQYTWGVQYSGTEFLGRHNGYRKGKQREATIWTSFSPTKSISTSARLKYRYEGKIKGIDPNIVLPTQTANPDYYGGNIITILVGLNWVCQSGSFKGVRVALEAGLPLLQELNGIQLEQNFSLMTGLQYAF
jgi:hypothetical protein